MNAVTECKYLVFFMCSETSIYEPPNNKVLSMTNNLFYPSNSKIYEKEPQYNETLISVQISSVPWFFVTLWLHCTLFFYTLPWTITLSIQWTSSSLMVVSPISDFSGLVFEKVKNLVIFSELRKELNMLRGWLSRSPSPAPKNDTRWHFTHPSHQPRKADQCLHQNMFL